MQWAEDGSPRANECPIPDKPCSPADSGDDQAITTGRSASKASDIAIIIQTAAPMID
jgi:hypothetical protein